MPNVAKMEFKVKFTVDPEFKEVLEKAKENLTDEQIEQHWEKFANSMARNNGVIGRMAILGASGNVVGDHIVRINAMCSPWRIVNTGIPVEGTVFDPVRELEPIEYEGGLIEVT